MKKRILLLTILCAYLGCTSKKSEEELLNKKNPSGIYGSLLSEGDTYNIIELISNKSIYLNKKVKVKGLIKEVCPMRGCWLEIVDENEINKLRIKVTDGEIVFPLSAKGRNIEAEGQFSILTLNKKQAKNWKKHLAAEKGIEIDTADIILSQNDYLEYRLNTNGAKIF
tara:strand:+ start:348 stop:851 length:504 start_codon:yes stop_codon:yes gene_type:complete